jgi:hypothetical protein
MPIDVQGRLVISHFMFRPPIHQAFNQEWRRGSMAKCPVETICRLEFDIMGLDNTRIFLDFIVIKL